MISPVSQQSDTKIPGIFISQVIIIFTIFSCFNVLYFLSQAAETVITADAWYSISTVIVKWATVGFDLLDCFVKRGLSDHALPADKIALFLSYRFFHLDFRIESLFGFLGLVAIIVTCVILYFDRVSLSQRNWLSAIAFLCAVMIMTSLNATNIYTWTLVTFGFVYIFLAVIVVLMTWKFLEDKSTFYAIAVTVVVFLLIGDTLTVMVWASLMFCVGIAARQKDASVRRRAIKWVIVTAVFVFAYYIILNGRFLFHKIAHLTLDDKQLVSWFDPFLYLEILRVVFSSSLVYEEHLQGLGIDSRPFSWFIALPVFGLYMRYFIVLFLGQVLMTKEKFVTSFLLIYATISIVAIVVGRVSIFGVDYLNQPRYVMSYQLIPFALLIDVAFSALTLNGKTGSLRKLIVAILGAGLLSVQLIFIVTAYKSIPLISQYNDNRARAIGDYWYNKSLPAGNCTKYTATLCKMTPALRNKLLSFLVNKELNIFNPTIQRRYRIYPFEHQITRVPS